MVHQLGPDSLRSGELARRRAMRTWAYCVAKNEFPGYEPGVSTIDLPRYAIDLDESLTEGDEVVLNPLANIEEAQTEAAATLDNARSNKLDLIEF